jgi:hypothetical protein
MRYIKRVLCFFYFLDAVIPAMAAVFLFSPGFRERYAQTQHLAHSRPLPSDPLALFSVAAFLGVTALVFGMAFFTVLMGKRSARYWVILPSLVNLVAAGAALFHSPVSLLSVGISAFVGVGGLALTWNPSWSKVPAREAPMPKNVGDGTSTLLNKAAQAVSVIGYLTAWWGCDLWMIRLGEPRPRGGLLLAVVLGFLVTLVHELGHTSIGLALHMRLRSFMAGPFEFRVREGKWTFKFNPVGLLTDAGATGVVPSTPNQPPWHPLVMIAAGPAANLYTGLIAIGFAWACSVGGGQNLDYVYPLGLFAAFNFVSCIVNMIPIRTGSNYSDGAKIFQLLSGGAWADYHRAVAVVGSSLVTPLQPRDYPIEAIKNASQTIAKGQMGLLLRLYAYSHYVDSGQFNEAETALSQAEAVYKDSASGIPAELHTVFVFANAVVRRDAGATRQWWDRMIAKNPKRKNCDYWRAQGALLWIEGDLTRAFEAWTKANTLAQQLPSAGAYEFDRTCCGLLRQAMDGKPLDTKAPPPPKPVPVAAAAAVVTQAPAAQWHFLNPGAPLGPSRPTGSD